MLNLEKEIDPDKMQYLLELSLIENRPEFVELLFENRVNLKTFLTQRRLYFMYNSSKVQNKSKKSPLYQILRVKRLIARDSTMDLKYLITFRRLKEIISEVSSHLIENSCFPIDYATKDEFLDLFLVNCSSKLTSFN